MKRAGPFAKEDGNGENCQSLDVIEVSDGVDIIEAACIRMNKFEMDSTEIKDVPCQGTTIEVLEGPTPEGLLYTLPYLGLKELLVLEGVSKVLRDAVRGDISLWQQLHVEDPLNRGITNDSLVKLSRRAQGRLQSLNLVKCEKISEAAIETVITSNPILQKLSIPGCTRVSPGAILRTLKDQANARSPGRPSLKQVHIRGLYGVTREMLDTLQAMLQPDEQQPTKNRRPQFYKNGDSSLVCDEGRAIDIEACPMCENVRVVYDCTREKCQQQQHILLQQCRGCSLCISRCEECGACVDGEEFEETFCLDYLCSSCWIQLPKCVECNRPGCRRHVDDLYNSNSSSFTCDVCQNSSEQVLWHFGPFCSLSYFPLCDS